MTTYRAPSVFNASCFNYVTAANCHGRLSFSALIIKLRETNNLVFVEWLDEKGSSLNVYKGSRSKAVVDDIL